MEAGKDYVGIGAWGIITKGTKVLLLKRHNKNLWERPGGKLEVGENLEETFSREVLEETGITIKNIKFQDYHQIFDENKKSHWLAIGFASEYESGETKILEPTKHEFVEWFDLDNLPENLTEYTKDAIETYKKTK